MRRSPARATDEFFFPLGLGLVAIGAITLFTDAANSVAHIFIAVGAVWIVFGFLWKRRRPALDDR